MTGRTETLRNRNPNRKSLLRGKYFCRTRHNSGANIRAHAIHRGRDPHAHDAGKIRDRHAEKNRRDRAAPSTVARRRDLPLRSFRRFCSFCVFDFGDRACEFDAFLLVSGNASGIEMSWNHRCTDGLETLTLTSTYKKKVQKKVQKKFKKNVQKKVQKKSSKKCSKKSSLEKKVYFVKKKPRFLLFLRFRFFRRF